MEEVKSAINGLKKHKAPGIDTLGPPVYKSFTEPLINHLTMLYNQVLSSGEYPSTWSVGKIKTIFKNGSKSRGGSRGSSFGSDEPPFSLDQKSKLSLSKQK